MIKKYFNNKGQASVGLLIVLLFVISMALYNAPNLPLLNKIAFATTGGGSILGGGGGGGGGTIAQCINGIDDDKDGKTDYPADSDCTSYNDTTEGVAVTSTSGGSVQGESALAILERIAGTPVAILVAGKLTGLTSETSNATVAIAALNAAGQLTTHVTIANAAVKQLLLGIIMHTISVIQVRITELSAA